MTRKDVAISIAFAAFWAVFMIWWSSDQSLPNIVILFVLSLAVGFGWTWFMKRFGFLT